VPSRLRAQYIVRLLIIVTNYTLCTCRRQPASTAEEHPPVYSEFWWSRSTPSFFTPVKVSWLFVYCHVLTRFEHPNLDYDPSFWFASSLGDFWPMIIHEPNECQIKWIFFSLNFLIGPKLSILRTYFCLIHSFCIILCHSMLPIADSQLFWFRHFAFISWVRNANLGTQKQV